MTNKVYLIIIGVLLFFVGISVVGSQSNYLIGLNADGSWEWANGSPTPVVVTPTSGPSQTPWIITATPEIVASPTHEVFTPTFTFTPTNTPDPLCQVENQTGGGIRVRNFPSTTNTETLGFIVNGQRVRPSAYYVGPTYTWYKIWWNEVIWGWTAADFYTYISGDCEGLLYENPF